MKRWYNRKPETMQDWLLLFAVAAALLAAVWYLPAIAAALRVLLGLATPFAGGLALAYVLDIPARWFAIHLFGGRRGPGILLAYLALFGTVAALVGLVVPQLVQSVGSFAAALPGYLENAQALLELVQANYGVDTTSLSELLLNSGSSVENFLSGLAPQLAQAAMGAAGQVVNGFLALAASVYLLCGKAELLHTARLALRTALPPRTAGNVLGVFAMANKTFSGYIGGQLVDAVLVGGETFVLMLLFGIPYAPLISVVVAVTNIVPMLGPYLGAVPGGSAAAVQRPAGACAGIFGHCSGGAAGGRKLYCAAHSGQRHGHFRPVGAGGYCGGRRTVRHSGHGHRGAGTGGGGQPCQSGPAQGTGWGKNKTGRGNIARNQCNIFHHTVCIMLRFFPLKSRR